MSVTDLREYYRIFIGQSYTVRVRLVICSIRKYVIRMKFDRTLSHAYVDHIDQLSLTMTYMFLFDVINNLQRKNNNIIVCLLRLVC
jgi:hypothetical protein